MATRLFTTPQKTIAGRLYKRYWRQEQTQLRQTSMVKQRGTLQLRMGTQKS
jgi:hypothetical protein